MLEASVEDFTRSRPAWAPGPLAGLAELRRRQGRTAEALALLDRAGPTRAAALPRPHRARPRRRRDAADLAERLLRQHRPSAASTASRSSTCCPCEPQRVVDGGRWVSELRSWPSWRARRRCGRSPTAPRAWRGATGALLEDAVDGFAGAPYEAAQARLELAGVLDGRARRTRARAGAPRRGAARARRRDVAAARADAARARGAALLAEGLTNRQLAERLVVSEHTVHRHVTNILRKLDVPHAGRGGRAGGPARPVK